MQFKWSKYNYKAYVDKEVLIFNTLVGSFTRLSKHLYETTDPNTLKEDTLCFMKEQGIVNDSDFDEDKGAFLKYMSIIDDGILDLIILPTMMCNFRCPYCYEEKVPGIMTDEVIDRIVNFAKKKLQREKALHVSWFGGEPLLCLKVIEKLSNRLMSLARAYRKNYSSNITTNGYLLNYETFKKLFREYRVTHYQITLDGRAMFHNKTRPLVGGGPTYDAILKNLLDIKNNCKSKLFKILVRTNLTSDTLADLDNQVRELEENFGGDNRFEFLFKAVGDWGGTTIEKISDTLIHDTKHSKNPILEKLDALDTTLKLNGHHPYFENQICYAAKCGTYTIDPNGNVMRCTVNLNSDYNKIGEIDGNGDFVEDIKNYSKWRYPAAPPVKKETKCEECALYANCFGVLCPIHHVASEGFPNCDQCENEFISLYKHKPELFKTM